MPDAQGNLQPGDPGYVPPGQGLINTTPGQTNVTPGAPVTGYTPATATATPVTSTGYDPTAFSVAPNQTVQEQVKNIVAADSPLMQQAATRAAQKANQRGLLNSSIAVGAGQEAVIGAAMPIAQADAATYDRSMTNTVNARNAAAAFKATGENQASQTNAQLQTNAALTNAAAFNTALGKQADAALQLQMQQFDTKTKFDLATLDAQNRQLLQSNVNAANMFQETVKNIAAIATSSTMSQEAKDKATASQIALLNEGLKTTAGIAATEQAAVTSLDLSKYFVQENPPENPVAQGGAGHWETPPYVQPHYGLNGEWIEGYQPPAVWTQGAAA